MKKIGVVAFHYISKDDGDRVYVAKNYCDAILSNGGVPFIIPVENSLNHLKEYIDSLDGLLITGGNDISPITLKTNAYKNVTDVSLERDLFEKELISLAVSQSKPIMGICRGMQILNVALGGTLIQDIPSQTNSQICHVQSDNNPAEPIHEVEISPDTMLSSALGHSTYVNSYHHQAIDFPAPCFTLTAHSSDGICEALESKEMKILAVQWHPEKMFSTDKKQNELFKIFLNL